MKFSWDLWPYLVLFSTGISLSWPLVAEDTTPVNPDQQIIRQQERERALREAQESRPDVRLQPDVAHKPGHLPLNETPCFEIRSIELVEHRSSSANNERGNGRWKPLFWMMTGKGI
ncbi:MAG: hypothetical protein SV765_13085 [Pseudomonadota bacterium]|nr:hypothetical protein [Pseudomonadota bacterium]